MADVAEIWTPGESLRIGDRFKSVTRINFDSDHETLPLQPDRSTSSSPRSLSIWNELPRRLAQISRALRPDGLLLAR